MTQCNRFFKHTLSQTRGFTLVEMLMAIVLVGILSAVAATRYLDFRNEARIATTQKKLFELREAIVGNPELVANGQYVKPGIMIDLGFNSSTIASLSLSTLVSQGSYSSFDVYEKRGWRGPYVDTGNGAIWSKDAWGTNFSFSAAGRELRSCGKDLTCGGSSSADDIVIPF